MTAAKRNVLVVGDLAVDWIDLPHPPAPLTPATVGAHCENWRLFPGTKRHPMPGGAFLLHDIIEKLLGASASVTGPACNLDDLRDPTKCIQSYMHADWFKIRRDNQDVRVLRISEYAGYDGPMGGPVPMDVLYKDVLASTKAPVDALVIDDAANGFRIVSVVDRLIDLLPADGSGTVVMKMSRPLDPPKTCTMNPAGCSLWSCVQEARKKKPFQLVVVLDVKDLRGEGAPISHGLSWERTSWDILSFFEQSGLLGRFIDPSFPVWLVIRIGLEGAMVIPPGSLAARDSSVAPPTAAAGPRRIPARLVFDPRRAEDDYDDTRKREGTMVGFYASFAAAVAAAAICPVPAGLQASLVAGAMAGLAAGRKLLDDGFIPPNPAHAKGGVPATLSYPWDAVTDAAGKAAHSKVFASTEVPPAPPAGGMAGACWSMVGQAGLAKIEETAIRIIEDGIENILRPIPMAAFGDLTTVDLSEIESYRTVQRLVREYRDAGAQNRPLSIGVFGKPGSGKSFGVKAVVGSILGKDAKGLTFNLSEFQSAADLARSFHKVHDLTRDEAMPLVFFDEFDCALNGTPCGWLKYFLAPMQDGKFNDGNDLHPIGRAIFVFAGGTKNSYAEFADQAIGTDAEKFVTAKGPDFLSRLRGHINILGTDPAHEKDYTCILRRAVLLRVALKERAKTLKDDAHWLLGGTGHANIDPNVVQAFLKVPAYRNGARSLSAIVEGCELSKSKGLTKASLPPASVLDMQVDAAFFQRLATTHAIAPAILLPARESLAKLVHRAYSVRNQSSTTAIRWEDLSEHHREQNRLQVDAYPAHLEAIGCSIEIANLVDPPYQPTGPELTVMAKCEHERWMRDKMADGWTWGKDKNDVYRTHPDIKDWSVLGPKEQQKDYDAVIDIPKLLKLVGLAIVKKAPPAAPPVP